MAQPRAPLTLPLTLALALTLAVGGVLQTVSAQPAQDAAQKSARANALVQAGKPEAAIPIYKELAAAFPAEPSLGTNLAIAQFKAGFYQDAVVECHRVLRLRPDLFPALLFLGASQLKLGDASSAVAPLRQALTLNPNDPNARIMLADALLASGRPREAAERYRESVQAMADSPRVWHGLERSYRAWAGELMGQLEKSAPGSAELLALSGDFAKDRLEFARAFQLYRQALGLRPTFRGLHTKIAEVYELTGHADWAVEERKREAASPCDSRSPECDFVSGRFEPAGSATLDTPEGLYWQSLALRALADRAYAKLQNDLPPSRERFEAAAEAHEQAARFRQAATAWKAALALAPGDSELERRLALALCHANDCVSALPLLKQLLAKKPASAELNYLAGLALNTTREPAQALPYLEKSVQLDATFLPAQAALGEALLEANSPERAIPHLQAALADDEAGTRRYQLARALQATGKRERAVTVLREYREIQNRRTTSQTNEPRITPP